MGKKTNKEDAKFTLTEWEFNYLKMLATVMTYNVAREKAVSGFMSYVATNRLGFSPSQNLQFEVDLDLIEQPYELVVKVVD